MFNDYALETYGKNNSNEKILLFIEKDMRSL